MVFASVILRKLSSRPILGNKDTNWQVKFDEPDDLQVFYTCTEALGHQQAGFISLNLMHV